MPVGVYAVQERIAEVPLATAVRFSSWVQEIFSETGVDEADPETDSLFFHIACPVAHSIWRSVSSEVAPGTEGIVKLRLVPPSLLGT